MKKFLLHALYAAVSLEAGYALGIWPEPETGVLHAATFTISVAVSIALSLAAGALARKRQPLAEDDKPTATSTRGSFIPLIYGIRRVGFIHGWVGNRTTRKEKAGGKGDSFAQRVRIFSEQGAHWLAVGQGTCIREIEQSGEVILEGPITPQSHPSGTTIDLGKEGAFEIYWGENDQPVNFELGEEIGVKSSWPGIFYIWWKRKRLGDQPIWPLITYVIEVAPPQTVGPGITSTTAYMEPTRTLHPTDTYAIRDVVTGAQGTAYLEINQVGGAESRFDPKQVVRLTGNTGLGADVDYTVRSVVLTEVMISPFVFQQVIRIFPEGGIDVSATDDGAVRPFDAEPDDGYNAAHILYAILFEPWPMGLSLRRSQFDLNTLEALATRSVTENLKMSVAALNGATVERTIGLLLQDLGVLWTVNQTSGLFEFVPVRKPTTTLPVVPKAAMTGRVPEIDKNLLANAEGDRLVFSFTDRENNHREVTFQIDSDGVAGFAEYYTQEVEPINTTINYDSAASVARRRQFERQGGTVLKLEVTRGGRLFKPGDAFSGEGFDEVLRVVTAAYDHNTGAVKLEVVPDYYGADVSTLLPPGPNLGDPLEPAQNDLAFDLVEVPEWLIDNGAMAVLFVRLRANSSITEADLHISRDDTTFTFVDTDRDFMAGGSLDAALTSLDDTLMDQGPTITALGPDIGGVEDLSTDLVSWRNGRQLVVFRQASTGRVEIGFLQKVTALGGDTYRLDGIIRARYNTEQLDLAPGDFVFILGNDEGAPIQDVLLEPGVTLHGKTQPFGNGSVSLANVESENVALYGKGVRPEPVANVQLDQDPSGAGINRWSDDTYRLSGSAPDDDLVFRWGYFTPREPSAGAGFSGAGVPSSPSPPEGDFLVEVLDSGDVVQRTTTVSTAGYTYSRADRLADFTTEPASFKLRVTQLRGGTSAAPVTTTFTSI